MISSYIILIANCVSIVFLTLSSLNLIRCIFVLERGNRRR